HSSLLCLPPSFSLFPYTTLFRSLDSLDPSDRIGVLSFDTQSRWVVQPRQLGQGSQVDQVKDRIRTIDASGGTEIYPALDMGFRRSEEHTSELQSRVDLVCRLLLE